MIQDYIQENITWEQFIQVIRMKEIEMLKIICIISSLKIFIQPKFSIIHRQYQINVNLMIFWIINPRIFLTFSRRKMPLTVQATSQARVYEYHSSYMVLCMQRWHEFAFYCLIA